MKMMSNCGNSSNIRTVNTEMVSTPAYKIAQTWKNEKIFTQILACFMNHTPRLILCPSIWLPKHLQYCTNTDISAEQPAVNERKQAERFHRFVFMTRWCHEVPLKGHAWLFLFLWNASSSHSFTDMCFLSFSQHTLSKKIFRWRVVPPENTPAHSHCFMSH